MVNLDTGQVASANVVPGVIDPQLWPEGGGWHLPVGPAHPPARQIWSGPPVGGTWPTRAARRPGRSSSCPAGGGQTCPSRTVARWKPRRSPPKSPASVARLPRPHRPRARPGSGPRPGEVVSGRRTCSASTWWWKPAAGTYGDLSWAIRYETPGADLPVEPPGWADDLPAAVAATSVDDALYGLGRTRPHRPRPLPASRTRLPRSASPGELIGSTSTRSSGGSINSLTEPANRARCRRRPGDLAVRSLVVHPPAGWAAPRSPWSNSPPVRLAAGAAPSCCATGNQHLPAWLGAPIPHHPCPDCAPGSRLQVCWCTRISPPVAPACPTCYGAGWHRHPAALRHLRGQPPRLPRSQHHHQRPDQPGSAPGVAGR